MQNQLFIDGAWVAPASGQMFDVIDPSDRSVFHQVAAGSAADVDAAVKAARTAFDQGTWPRMSGSERAAILRKMGDEITARTDE